MKGVRLRVRNQAGLILNVQSTGYAVASTLDLVFKLECLSLLEPLEVIQAFMAPAL